MAKAKLTLYLDVVSPFGYMAFYITRVRADVITNALSFLIMRAPFTTSHFATIWSFILNTYTFPLFTSPAFQRQQNLKLPSLQKALAATNTMTLKSLNQRLTHSLKRLLTPRHNTLLGTESFPIFL